MCVYVSTTEIHALQALEINRHTYTDLAQRLPIHILEPSTQGKQPCASPRAPAPSPRVRHPPPCRPPRERAAACARTRRSECGAWRRTAALHVGAGCGAQGTLGNGSWSSARVESIDAFAPYPGPRSLPRESRGAIVAGAGAFACAGEEERRTHQAGGRTVIHTADACAAAAAFSTDPQHEREHRCRPARTLRDAPPSALAAAAAAAPRTTCCAGVCRPHSSSSSAF